MRIPVFQIKFRKIQTLRRVEPDEVTGQSSRRVGRDELGEIDIEFTGVGSRRAIPFPTNSHRAPRHRSVALGIKRPKISGDLREARIQFGRVGMRRGEFHRAFGIQGILAREHFATHKIDLFFPEKNLQVHPLDRHRLHDNAICANPQKSIQRTRPPAHRAFRRELTGCLAKRTPEKPGQGIQFLDVRPHIRQKRRLRNLRPSLGERNLAVHRHFVLFLPKIEIRNQKTPVNQAGTDFE